MKIIDKNRHFVRESARKELKAGSELAVEPVFYSFAYVKAKTDYEYKKHVHPLFEIIVPEKGTYKCILNGENIQLSPGEFLIVQTGDIHQDIFTKGMEYSALTFFLKSADSGREARLFKKINAPGQRAKIPQKTSVPELLKLLRGKASEQKDNLFGFYILSGLFNSIFWEMIPAFPESLLTPFFIKSAKNESFRITFLKYLNENLGRKLSIGEMAKTMKMSESSFAHISSKILGTTPAKMFLACKLERAATLLKESNMTIKEVSDSLAFEDQFHFSKAFRKHFGVPPSTLK